MARTVPHSRLGDINLVAQPCEITGFDRSIDAATPDLGEHNDEVLRSLGYDAEGIEKLKAAKAHLNATHHYPEYLGATEGAQSSFAWGCFRYFDLRGFYNAARTAFAISLVPSLPPNSIGLMPSA